MAEVKLAALAAGAPGGDRLRFVKYDRIAAVPLAAAVVAAAAIAAFATGWGPHISAPSGRAAIESGTTLAALAAAGLLVAQYRRRHQLHELLLLSAVVAFALTDFVFSAMPPLIGTNELPLDIEAAVACQSLVPLVFALAALGGDRTIRARRWWLPLPIGVACIAIVAVAEIAGLLAGSPGVSRSDASLMLEVGAPAAAVFLLAGVAFVRRPSPSGDGCLMGGVSFLLAGARLQALALPLVAVDWITPRELLRLAAYGLLVAAAARELIVSRRADQQEALAAQRERIARDLHDGLAQDLAVIAVHGQRLEAELGAQHPVTVAARRALAASRRAIVDLSASHAPSTGAALREVAAELEARFDIDVAVRDELRSADGLAADLDRSAREQFVRIAREAIVNAARHGQARHIDVVLSSRGPGWRLTVADDGCGITPSQLAAASGFGLGAMQARARELGGRLSTSPGISGGTVLELSAPSPVDEG
ncbi:MAG: sensor histidine kinase [Solirubrobacteraceae bacterium]